MDSVPKANLWISLDNVNMLALSIPLAECSKFAVNPLKWLRFLGFAIYGREGYLSTSEAGPEIHDYTAVIQARSYYYISDCEPCLVDVKAADGRTSTSSYSSRITRCRDDFRRRVIERDRTCLISGDVLRVCHVCHIIPHSKGHNYISNVSNYRGRTGNPFVHINDTRNGLLLQVTLHRFIKMAYLAFLKTPNFAMDVDDVPYLQERHVNEQHPSNRLTLHHFVGIEKLGIVINRFMPNNSDLRQPQDTSNWPPAVIVDLLYAAAALKAWGSKDFIEFVRKKSRDAYYDSAEENDVELGDGAQSESDDMEDGSDNSDSWISDLAA